MNKYSAKGLRLFLYVSIVFFSLCLLFEKTTKPTKKYIFLKYGYIAVCDDRGNEILNTKKKVYFCEEEKFYLDKQGNKHIITLRPYWGLRFSPNEPIESYTKSFLNPSNR